MTPARCRSQTADLSTYAGKTVLLGFRHITDGGVNEGGFWVRNIKVGTTSLPTASGRLEVLLARSNPTPVTGYTVQLVGIRRQAADVLSTGCRLTATSTAA